MESTKEELVVADQPIVVASEKKKRPMSEKQLEALKRGRLLANEAKRLKKETASKQIKEEVPLQKSDVVDVNIQTPPPAAEPTKPELMPKKPKKYARQKTASASTQSVAAKQIKKPIDVASNVSEEEEEDTLVDDEEVEEEEQYNEEDYISALPTNYFRRVIANREHSRTLPKIQISFG